MSDVGPQKYWMSLEQWRQDPEFLKMAEQEFQSSPLKSSDGQDGWARREFLKLMGASLALTTFGCVRRTAQQIIPYAKKPLEVIHGFPNFYASSCIDGQEGLGIVVTTRDGRPIKIEGNTEHPWNEGGMSPRAHAQILRLYDPDRFTSAKHNLLNEKKTNRETVHVEWDQLDKAVVEQLKKGGVAVLSSTNFSPSTRALMNEFASSYGAELYKYDDISYEHVREAAKACYGRDAIPAMHLEKAKLVVSVNSDFLGTWLTPVHFQRSFMKARRPGANMNKLVVFESLLTLTGTNADERVRIKPSQTLDVLLAMTKEIIGQTKFAADSSVTKMLSMAPSEASLGLPSGSIREIGAALVANKGQSLVLAGGPASDSQDALSIQIVTNFLNAALENVGHTIDATSAITSGQGSLKSVAAVIAGLNSGRIKTLIIHGCNPMYSVPSSAGLRDALAKAQMVIYTGDRQDETAKMADFVATDHHPLENWNDMEMVDGVLSIQQPTIEPLYKTRAFQDSLIAWIKESGKGGKAKAAKDWHDYLQMQWKELSGKGSGFDDFWVSTLQTGVYKTSGKSAALKSFSTAALSQVKKTPQAAGFELALYPKVGMLDAGLANVSWLQELPDPVTKICWDNYLCLSPADASHEKIKEGQMVEITCGDNRIKAPAHIQPGQAQGVIGLAIGYGRKGGGKIADDVGVNAYQLAQYKDGQVMTGAIPAMIKGLPEEYPLASVQTHHTMEGRQIVVEETLAQYLKKPGSTIHHHNVTSIWSEHEYKGNKWGMSIDLNSCTGCGSCVIACQSENNIPSVGKKYVLTGREMHWIRIDRYYAGDADNPETLHQPMLCQHCDNAPCETVCPVIATMHSDEGTNDMIYNRCVGTRYCSNNCPYKVRRFNWFSYTDVEKPLHLAMNPEVTVRHRGVMEKCTFCIHRIRQTKARFYAEGKTLVDGDIKSACQQSCPTNAIQFGDTNNPESVVSKVLKAENRYMVLEELNTKPAVKYLTKVRNSKELKGNNESYNQAIVNEEGEHT